MTSLEEFRAAAAEFLAASASVRGAKSAPATGNRYALFHGATVEEAAIAREWQRRLYDAGFAWITGPEVDGGRGLPKEYERAFLELERQYAVPSKAALSVSLGMVAPTVEKFAHPDVRSRWLPKLFRADAVGCQLFSEPGAGSDLASVRCRAERDGDEWVLNGQKVWTSGAHYSDIGIALTRTASAPRHRNLTAFLVEMNAPGLEVRPLRQITGGTDFNEVFLTDVRVPDTHRLGEVDDGWRVALAMLGFERGAIGGSSTGGAGLFNMESLAAMLHEAGRADDPAVVQAFARVYCGVTAAKAMRRRADASAKAGVPPGPEMSLAKLALTSNLVALAELVSQVLGPQIIADTTEAHTFAWSEFVLGVPGMRIGGGTDEIQRTIIAERVLGLPKEPGAAR